MIIKVCGMRDTDNILELIEKASPDLMGMIFYAGSPRFVEKEKIDYGFYKALPIKKVGIFVNADLEYILQKIDDFALDVVQLHGDESVEFITQLKSVSSIKIIKVIRLDKLVDWQEVKVFEELVDLFLFDTKTEKFGGSGIKFDWSVLESYPLRKGFLLSGGVDEKSCDTIQALAIKIPQLVGVDINSKFELQAGVKEIEKVRKFVEEVRGYSS
ncbi:MAG TPA: phosphoribosylanthranilate isomerase [Cyclobacteriaceae bacterium]|nr:phosphoribosylanthranilate isomerase [Cyclobacteriaceae bacterium]